MRTTAGRRDGLVPAVWAHSEMPLPTIRLLLEEMARNETGDGDAQLHRDEPGQAAAVPEGEMKLSFHSTAGGIGQ